MYLLETVLLKQDNVHKHIGVAQKMFIYLLIPFKQHQKNRLPQKSTTSGSSNIYVLQLRTELEKPSSINSYQQSPFKGAGKRRRKGESPSCQEKEVGRMD